MISMLPVAVVLQLCDHAYQRPLFCISFVFLLISRGLQTLVPACCRNVATSPAVAEAGASLSRSAGVLSQGIVPSVSWHLVIAVPPVNTHPGDF